MKTHKLIFAVFATMVLGAFVITGCSNEEERATPNQYNKKEIGLSVEDLKREWKIISSSVEYLNFLSSVDSFGSKLPEEATHYTGNREIMLSWIEANISLTNFNNFDEAESELIEIEESYLNIMVSNKMFFDNVGLIDNPYQDTDIFMPFPFQPEAPVTAAGPCVNDCINAAVMCSRSVNNTYALAMEAVDSVYKLGNLPLAATMAVAATIAQHAGQRACANTFKNCMKGCE